MILSPIPTESVAGGRFRLGNGRSQAITTGLIEIARAEDIPNLPVLDDLQSKRSIAGIPSSAQTQCVSARCSAVGRACSRHQSSW